MIEHDLKHVGRHGDINVLTYENGIGAHPYIPKAGLQTIIQDMKLMILTLEEKETIQLRRDDTNHYRTYGDPSVYMLPPCIILGENGNFDERIEIPSSFTLLKGISASNPYSSYMPIMEMDRIHDIQESLGLPKMDTGLFTSFGKTGNPYSTDLEEIRVKNLEIVELDRNTARTIRRRPLRRY